MAKTKKVVPPSPGGLGVSEGIRAKAQFDHSHGISAGWYSTADVLATLADVDRLTTQQAQLRDEHTENIRVLREEADARVAAVQQQLDTLRAGLAEIADVSPEPTE